MIKKINNINILFILAGLVFVSSAFIKPDTDASYILIADQQTDLQESIARGKEVYTEFCVQCHLATGKGNGDIVPPLDSSDWLEKKKTESIHAVKYGQAGEIIVNSKKYNGTMPPMGLSNEEIADVMNYVRNSWSNKHSKMITVAAVVQVKP